MTTMHLTRITFADIYDEKNRCEGHGGNVGPAYKAFADLAAEERQGREENEAAALAAADMETAAAERPKRGGSSSDDSDSDSRSSASRGRLKLISWYAGRESSALAKELYGGEVGQHATPDEVNGCDYSRTVPKEHEKKKQDSCQKDVTFSRIVTFIRNPDFESC